jgi:hypothetical protein
MKNKYGLILGMGLLVSIGSIGYSIYKGEKNNLTKVDKALFGAGLLSLAATYSYGIDKNPNLKEIEKQNKLESITK